nr:MAG TPA: hypothetical protein [Caudoviricetes sp.]
MNFVCIVIDDEILYQIKKDQASYIKLVVEQLVVLLHLE